MMDVWITSLPAPERIKHLTLSTMTATLRVARLPNCIDVTRMSGVVGRPTCRSARSLDPR